MAKKKSKPESKLKYKSIIVAITEESFIKIAHEASCQRMCYGDATMADTIAMEKILKAIAEGKTVVVI